MRASHPGICDPNGKGGVATLSCGGFEVVAHTSSLTTVECFYEPDGGALSGALNFTDTSIGAWGIVADCQRTAQVPCLDGGLVQSLAALPEIHCGKAQRFDCPNDAGPCITWDTASGQEVVATRDELGTFQNVEGLVEDALLFMKRSADGGTDMSSAAPGRTPNVIASSERLYLSGLATSPAIGWWFVGTYGNTSNDSRHDVANAAHNRGVSVAMPSQTSSATSNGAAYNSWYFVALTDGLYEYYPAGGSRLVTLTAISGDTIQSIAADEASDTVFYVRFDTVNGYRLWRIARTGGTETLLTQLPRMNGVTTPVGGMLALHGGYVYVLGVRGVYRIPMTGGQLELVYAGHEFPQYGGTLKNGSLVRHGDKLYFGEVCHVDFDAPGYGTVELDLTQLTARWLDLDPAFPVVPHVTGYQSWDKEGPVYASPAGAFIVRE